MNKKLLTGVCLLAFAPMQSFALDPQSVNLGGMALTPTLKIAEKHDDNVWNTGGRSPNSWYTEVDANFNLAAQDRLNVYQINYNVFGEYFNSSSNDNHTDHSLTGNAHLEFDARNRLDLSAGYTNAKARRDTTNNANNESGNESTNKSLGALYSFGAKSARGQLDINADMNQLRYDNNYNAGSTNRLNETDTKGIGATFYWRIAPKTRLLAEAQFSDVDYKASTSLLDNDNQKYLLGVTWEATAKTTGIVKLGRSHKDYDSATKNDDSTAAWTAEIIWEPRTYSKFTFRTSSDFEGGSTSEDNIETSSYSVDWDHAWSNLLSSNVYYRNTDEEYNGGTNANRDDDTDAFGASLSYSFRRWIDIGAEISHTDLDSNQAGSSYDKTVSGVFVRMSL